jgi:hypothetical protein
MGRKGLSGPVLAPFVFNILTFDIFLPVIVLAVSS